MTEKCCVNWASALAGRNPCAYGYKGTKNCEEEKKRCEKLRRRR